MKKTNRIILFLLATLLMGCAERLDEVGDDALTDFNLSVNLGMRTPTDPNAVNAEEAIYSARLIVVGTVKGNANYQKVTCNQYFSAADISADRIIRARTRTGVSDIYLIINEEARISTDVSAPAKPLDYIATLGDLEKATLAFPASPVVGGRHIPMMRCFRGVDILPDLTTHVGGDFDGGQVERMWAKVRVRFKSRDEDLTAGKLDLTGAVINSVELHNIPKYVRMVEGQPYDGKLTEVDRLITKNYTLAKTIASDEQGYVFYMPEYLLEKPSNQTSFLQVKATVRGKERTYYMRLRNKTFDDEHGGSASDWSINRNKFYDYTCTVCSLGQSIVDIEMNVLPWNVVNSNSVVGGHIKLSTSKVDILEMEEDVTITYTGRGSIEILKIDDSIRDKIFIATLSGENGGEIYFKRRDVVHDGRKHSGVIIIKSEDTNEPPITLPVSIEQYSVNVGGTLKATADGLKHYWSGGVNWATGNLTIQNPALNIGMTISTDPYNRLTKDMFFKFQSRVAAYHDFTITSRLYDGSGTVLIRDFWSQVISMYNNDEPCKNAGQIAGEEGIYDNPNPYWRLPTKAEAETLVSHTPVDGGHIAVYKSRLGFADIAVLDWNTGKLARSASNNWTSTVANTADPIRDNWTAYSFHASAHVMQVQNINYGFYVRCVRTNTL